MGSRRVRNVIYKGLSLLIALSIFAQSATPLLAMPKQPQTVEAASAEPQPEVAEEQAANLPTGRKEVGQAKPLLSPAAQEVDLDTLTLLPGWNLLATPKQPPSTNPSAVFAPITGDYNVVYGYDGCNSAAPWQVFDPAAPPASNDLAAVTHKIGFWIQTSITTTLPLAGTIPPTSTIELCEGWNLIGLPMEQARPVRNALYSIEGRYSLVFGYDPADPADPWQIYDTAAPDWSNDLEMMLPGRGYWILATEDTTLTIANVGEDPIANLISPSEISTEISSVTFITDVIGTAYSDILESWTLSYRMESESNWIPFAFGTTPVLTDVLDQFDPTLLLNGIYEIELTAMDYSGVYVSAYAKVLVEEGAKLGHFSLAYTDVEVPLAGLPLQVIRRYDSRDKRTGDFGVGWTLELSNIRLEESAVPGDAWQSTLDVPGGPIPFFSYCIEPVEPHVVTITFPDDEVYSFLVKVIPACQLFIPQRIVNIRYEPLPGTRGTLTALDMNSDRLMVIGSFPPPPLDFGGGSPSPQSFTPPPIQFWIEGGEAVYDPNLYELKMQDGRSFVISQDAGLLSMSDYNGQTLTVSENGITHSSGRGLAFERDQQGRIIQITDPMSNTLHYEYDSRGDLIQVTNQANYTSTYTYNDNHHLLTIVDPRRIQVARNEYDDDGRLVRLIDADGKVTTYIHDLEGREEIVVDRLGYQNRHYFDLAGNVISTTNALGDTFLFSYDEDGNMLTQTDPFGETVTRAYDGVGNMLNEINPLGHTITRTYNLYSQILTHTDNNGAITSFTYDSRGNLLTLTDAMGTTVTNTYDAAGNLIAVTDPDSQTTTLQYDAFGNVLTQTNPLGHTLYYSYDQNGNELEETANRTDANGLVSLVTTERVYDGLNRVTETIGPGENHTLLTYTPVGQLASITTNGYRVEHEYDDQGNPVRSLYPDGTEEISVYDDGGRRVGFTDRTGETTTFEYDALNRIVRTNYPDGTYTLVEYDAAGRITAQVDENGNRTQFVHDALGRRTQLVDALDQVTTLAHDSNWNLVSITDPLSQTITYQYDDADRKTATVFPDGTSERYVYDEFGRMTTFIDQANLATHYNYNELGRLVQVTDSLDGTTTFGYDEMGNQLSQTDANGHVTRWAYDDLGRVVSRTLPLGMIEQYRYDASSNLISRTDFNGQTITYTYNLENQLISKQFPDGTAVYYDYAPGGLLSVVTDTLGVTTFAYDQRGRLSAVTNAYGATIQYDYDGVGNRTLLTLPSGATSYNYDPLNRLESVIDATGITSYTFDAANNLTQVTYPNGTLSQYGYDSLNQLVDLTHLGADQTVIASYQYTLGPAGNRLGVVENDRSASYRYDDLYRVVQEIVTDTVSGNWATTYSYDPVGNLLTKTENGVSLGYSYDDNDRLAQLSDTLFSYDNNGNLQQQVGLTETISYGYNFANQLMSVSSPGLSLSYTYDFAGSRIAAGNGSNTTRYLIDKTQAYEQVVEEHDSSNNLLARYLYGYDLVAEVRNGTPYYFHYDGLGSTRALSDENGAVAATFQYDAYGNMRQAGGTATTSYLFTGEQYDSSLGSYYLRARYYSPQLSRFLTMDTFPGLTQQPLTLNKYLYADANPINRVDPSGNLSGDIKELNVSGLIIGQLARTGTTAVVTGGEATFVGTTGTTVAIGGAGTGAAGTAGTAIGATGISAAGFLIRAGLAAAAMTITSVGLCVAGLNNVPVVGYPSPCNTRHYNVLLPGQDTPQSTEHVKDAISSWIPWVFLIRGPEQSRYWLQKDPRCTAHYQNPGSNNCDEYPYNKTRQGGGGAKPLPSLRVIPAWDNQLAGNKLGYFYTSCNLSVTNPLKGFFFVVPTIIPFTFHQCKY